MSDYNVRSFEDYKNFRNQFLLGIIYIDEYANVIKSIIDDHSGFSPDQYKIVLIDMIKYTVD